jgi:hypothetical protein
MRDDVVTLPADWNQCRRIIHAGDRVMHVKRRSYLTLPAQWFSLEYRIPNLSPLPVVSSLR